MKIIEIGTDIVEIKRMKIFLDKKSLLNKTFTKNEINYSKKYKNPLPHFAVQFAAKEAVLKILKIKSILYFKEIEITHKKNGSPEIKFSKSLNNFLKKIKINFWKISLSHEKEYAIAFILGGKK